ncbi:MAG: hypothetical protein DGJ47_000542 [Rickettsiaceae bacterium]
MSFQEDLTEFLDIEQGFADIAIIQTFDIYGGDDTIEVKGIFSAEYVDIDVGMNGVSGRNASFECMAEEVECLQYGDKICIGRQEYYVRDFKPDGTGWTILVLEKTPTD